MVTEKSNVLIYRIFFAVLEANFHPYHKMKNSPNTVLMGVLQDIWIFPVTTFSWFSSQGSPDIDL